MKNGLIIKPSGNKFYYLNGKIHREDGPAIEWNNGDKEWWINGKLHRENGPAIEYIDGSKQWYINNKRHREDGPAIESANGCYKKWFYDGEIISVNSQEEFELYIKYIVFR